MKSLTDDGLISPLKFHDHFIKALPGDPEMSNYRRGVYGACYSFVKPAKASSPNLIAYSTELANDLGLKPEFCNSPLFTGLFSGNIILDGMKPYASCYGGHQFGTWAGQLGDGRCINLGELETQNGQMFSVQIKGSGPTPYSRMGDGFAVLRSSIREFLASEAMYHLGVPTTRALSIIQTGNSVVRDLLYDGNPRLEPGAIVCRTATSFVRFGHFELYAARGDIECLKRLADYTIIHQFPHLGAPSSDIYTQWFFEICERTARLIAEWKRVGFVHGVMNTDNMAITGDTIDYGPFGWLDQYDENWTPNLSDNSVKRYRFRFQVEIAKWNLFQLARAISPLVKAPEELLNGLDLFSHRVENTWHQLLAKKLGVTLGGTDSDTSFCEELFNILQSLRIDMTVFFRKLAELEVYRTQHNRAVLLAPLKPAFYDSASFSEEDWCRLDSWVRTYVKKVQVSEMSNQQRIALMNRSNPKFILRNYLAQQAIEKAESGDFSMVMTLAEVLRNPYEEQHSFESLSEKQPENFRKASGNCALSCSS